MDLISELDSTDGGQDPFLESLCIHVQSAYPTPFRSISWTMCLVSSLRLFLKNFKFFPFLFEVFWIDNIMYLIM